MFEHNAKEGVRFVTFRWLTLRVVIPVLLVIALVVLKAAIENGQIAGVLSAVLFAAPFLLIVTVWWDQFKKVYKHLRK